MRFIITRHALTDWNVAERLQGQTNTHINDVGRVQAEDLAKNLAGLEIALIVSSDLHRARETAEILKLVLKVPLRLEPGLRECSFGTVEGLTRPEAIEKYGAGIFGEQNDSQVSYDFRNIGGEDSPSVLTRHLETIKTLSQSVGKGPVLLVGHGLGISTLLFGLGYPASIKRGEYKVIEY